jgi:hypothetical protein
MADLSDVADLLQTTYLPGIQEILNNKTMIRDLLSENSEDFVGDHIERPLHIRRNYGHGSRAESGTLPTAGKQGYTKALYYMKYHYGKIQVTGPAIAKTSTSGSYISVVDAEVNGMVQDLLKDQNRQAWGESVGTICNITDSIASNVAHTVDTTNWLTVADSDDRPTYDVVAINTTTNNATVSQAGVHIDSISGNTVTFSTAFASNAASTEYVIVLASSMQNERYGLTDLINNTNPRGIGNFSGDGSQTLLGGINRATAGNEFWQSGVNNNSGINRAFSTDMFDTAEDWANTEGDGEIDYHITTFNIWRKYARQLVPDRRYQSMGAKFEKLDGGYAALTYNEAPILKDKDCPPNKMFSIAANTIEFYPLTDWEWMDKDGAILHRLTTDGYEATIFKYENMGIWDPRDNHVTEDIEE